MALPTPLRFVQIAFSDFGKPENVGRNVQETVMVNNMLDK